MWSGNEGFPKHGEVCDKLSPTYKGEASHLVKIVQQWRHCILIGPGDAQCWGLNPRFDDIMQKYVDSFD